MHSRGRGRGGTGPAPARGWVRGGAPAATPKVWRRDATAAPSGGVVPPEPVDGARKRSRVEEAAMEGSLARPADPGPATKRQATADAEVKAALDAKLHEAEKLRKQIEEKNRLLAEQRAAVKRATEAQAKAVADEAANKEKSRKLAAGFSAVRAPAAVCQEPQSLSHPAALATPQAVQRVTVDRNTQGGRAAGGASAGPEAARRAADEAEVTRVLGSLTDADVLGLPPRPSAEVVKQAYRMLAKKLHPDKCTASRAKDAFQRVHKAYQRLSGDGAAAGRA